MLNALQNFCADLVSFLVLNRANASKFMKQFMKDNEYSFQLKMSTITGETTSIATHYKGE
jgi:hypothetical protein